MYGANVRTSVIFYNAVFQETLLFGSETCMVTPRIRRNLGGFHHRVACCILWMNQWHNTTGRCYYPPLEAVIAAAGLEEVDTYILDCQNNISKYIVTLPVLGLCLEAV